MNYDIIGDIHGHADALTVLLHAMDYRETAGAWHHPQRQAVFVGDFIDRGPKQVVTVDIVRRMVEAGHAQAVMGNHELNAIAWFLPDPDQPGEFLRPHFAPRTGVKNYDQHKAFLAEVADTPRHEEIIDWFLTLPLWLDLGDIRVAHACWHPRYMAYLAPTLAAGNRLTKELMSEASREPASNAGMDAATPSVFKAVEAITKGVEIALPKPHTFLDRYGHRRHAVRTRWWDAHACTYRSAALLDDDLRSQLPNTPIPADACLAPDGGAPIFVGHYWFNGTPILASDIVACVDYSIGDGGKLVAYRWDGEAVLDQNKFFWVGAPT